jgi:tetratricopeptide (TPR) repeat protein
VTASDRAPYPGLRSFKREETDLFFGRDDCVDAMIERLSATRFLAVLGSSGTGKSSLVKTGLPAGLEMGLLEGAGSRWRIVEFRPEDTPLRNLARRLLETQRSVTESASKAAPSVVEINLLRARLSRGPRSLIEWCREGNLPEGMNLLLLVDQFEELFRYEDGETEEAEAFVALLLESRYPTGADSPQQAELPIYVTLTMRSEYLGACALFEDLADAINNGAYLIPRMTREQCREAIVGPAKVCGIEIEPALANRLLNDLATFAPWDDRGVPDQLSHLARRADQLPVMQHTLNQMWRKAEKESKEMPQLAGRSITLTLAEYEAIGGVAGALDQHAGAILQQLGPVRGAVAETIFRALTSGTTVANAVRRPTSFGELVKICNGDEAAVRATIDAFRAPDCNFLMPEIDHKPQLDDKTTIDIAHESLIRQWSLLSTWLEKEGRAAHEWQRLDERAQGKELLRGSGLENALRFRRESKANAAWAERYGGNFDRVKRLLDASVRLQRLSVAGKALAAVIALALVGYLVESQSSKRQDRIVMEQRTAFGVKNFELAVTSAQKLLDKLSSAVARGDITIKGANDMLQVANAIVEQVHSVESTPETIGLLINLECTASDIYATLGSYTQAYDNAKKARNLAEPLRAADPDNPEILELLYSSIWRMGDATAMRGANPTTQEQALKEYREAEALARRRAELAPSIGARRRDLMFIHQKIGDVRQTQKNWDAAIAEYNEALMIIQGVAAEVPDNRDWQREVAITLRRIGQVLATEKDFDGALERLKAALKILNDLAQRDLNDNVVQSNLAGNHRDIAVVYVERGDLAAGSAEYELSVELQKRLMARDRDNANWQFSLASSYTGLGGILKQQGDLAGALDRYQKAYALRQELAGKDRTNPGRQSSLARAAIPVADLLVALKQDLGEAVKLYREAIDILDEARPRYDREVFECYIRIGDVRVLQDDWEDALKEYQRASAIARDIVAGEPGNVTWQKNLATSYIKIGDLLAAQRRSHEALEYYKQALEIITALAAKSPRSEGADPTEALRVKIQNLALTP